MVLQHEAEERETLDPKRNAYRAASRRVKYRSCYLLIVPLWKETHMCDSNSWYGYHQRTSKIPKKIN